MKYSVILLALGVVVGVIVWIWIFCYGITMPSVDLMEELRDSKSLFSVERFRWIISNTFTNTALLAIMMGYIGAAYRLLTIRRPDRSQIQDSRIDGRTLLCGVVRAFIVFLLFLSGSIIVLDNPIESLISSTPHQYIKVAASISVLSFLAGWKPELFVEAVASAEHLGDPSPE